ncbi:MAG: RHS repeat-associated core domain-containing protein, partial [Leptothrix ochracea]
MPGQIFDKETGLHHNGHRDYNPATGRYIQPDPIGLEGGINRYGYVGGNPVSRIDPRGLTTVVVLSGSVSSNPFGHIGVATTGSGVYSYGTADPYGGSF